MSKTRRYYWLKLMSDFFTQPKIKKLRRIAGGDTYTIIYLKMQLLSIKNEGKIFFEGIEDDFIEELALIIDEDVENVRVTVMYLMKQGLLEEVNQNEFAVVEAMKNIGSETAGAERVRRHRKLKEAEKALLCNTPVTICNVEIEKEKDIELDKEKDISVSQGSTDSTPASDSKKSTSKSKKEVKHKYGEFQHVLLTDTEKDKLFNEYGESLALEAIKYLDESIEMKGYKYKSHYLAIRKWVIDAVKEKQSKKSFGNNYGPKRTIENVPEWFKKKEEEYDSIEKPTEEEIEALLSDSLKQLRGG